jgi:hypothetical protein
MEGKLEFRQEIIKCDVHGEASWDMTLMIDNKQIGRYCFQCYNDFLKKNLKDYSK